MITLIIQVSVSFGLDWRNAELFDIYLIIDPRTKNFQAYIQTTSCLQANCIFLYILSWSIRIDSPSLVWIYSASWTVTSHTQWEIVLHKNHCYRLSIRLSKQHTDGIEIPNAEILLFQNSSKTRMPFSWKLFQFMY